MRTGRPIAELVSRSAEQAALERTGAAVDDRTGLGPTGADYAGVRHGAAACDASKVGMECLKCGDGEVEFPPEECDASPALKMGATDGCTQRCQRACGPRRPCAQPC